MIHAENARLKIENRELRDQVTGLMRTVMDLREQLAKAQREAKK